MSKKLSAAKLKERSQRNRAIIQIAVVAAFVVAAIVFYFRAVLSHPTLDSVTLCPSKTSSVTVLLVDVTDPMNLPQRQDFTNQLETLMGHIPRYGKLVVTKVDPISNRLLRPVITRCNPGSGSEVSETNDNPQQVERLRREGFEEPLRQVFDTLLSASEAARSPILESIQSVVLTELRRPDLANSPKHLILASDLLQNTAQVRFYTRLPDAAQFTRSQEFSRLRTDLRGIQVEIWMLQRDDSKLTQPRELPELWERIIAAQGGILNRVYVVSG